MPRNDGKSTPPTLVWGADTKSQPAEYGLTVAIFTLGGLVGSMSAGHLTGRLGRVGCLRAAASSTLIGLIFVGLANYVRVMIVGRILVGYGCGLSIAVVPLYLAELPPK